MSGGGGGAKNGTQTTRVELPGWLDQGAQDTWGLARNIAGQPYQGYGGQTVAGMTADQQQAQQGVRDMQGQTTGFLSGLAGQSAVLADYRPTAVAGRTLAGTDLAPYMNPYVAGVESYALDALNGARRQQQNELGAKAASAGAFGGSRMALQSAVTDAAAAENAGKLSAGLRSAAFDNAQRMAVGDIDRLTGVDRYNQELGLAGVQSALGALGQAGTMAGNAQRAGYADLAALEASGQQQQAQAQRTLDDNFARWAEARDYPVRNLNVLLSTLGGTPYGTTSTTQVPVTQRNPAMSALGGAASGAATGAMITPYAPYIGGAVGALIGGAGGYFAGR